MRTSTIVTISLPPKLERDCAKLAKRHNMTRSELLRTALRRFVEESRLEEALRVANAERRAGKMRVLKSGGLASLMR